MRKLLSLGLIVAAMLLGVSAPSAAINLRQDDDGTKSSTMPIPTCTGSGKALTHDPTNQSTPFGCNTIAGGGVPSGLIAFSNGPCPSGWSEVTGAQGRIIVGTPSGGTDGGTVGTAFTDLQNKSVTPTFTGDGASLTHSGTAVADHASHTHTYTQVPNHVHPLATGTGSTGNFSQVIGTVDTSSGGTGGTPTQTALGTLSGNPNGGVATGTTAGPSATLTHAVTQPSAHNYTPTGTVSAVTTSSVIATIQYRVCSKD